MMWVFSSILLSVELLLTQDTRFSMSCSHWKFGFKPQIQFPVNKENCWIQCSVNSNTTLAVKAGVFKGAYELVFFTPEVLEKPQQTLHEQIKYFVERFGPKSFLSCTVTLAKSQHVMMTLTFTIYIIID